MENFCPDIELPCGNEGCQEKVKRCLMDDHYDVCLKEVVSCQYDTVGCETRLKREDMSTHEQEYVGKHLKNAVKTVENLQSQMKDLQCEIGPTVTIKLPGLEGDADDLYSESVSTGFYTYPKGYKIRLKGERSEYFQSSDSSSSDYDDEGDTAQKLSVYVALMPGRYDDILESTFRGKITVEFLNQERNEGHLATTMYMYHFFNIKEGRTR